MQLDSTTKVEDFLCNEYGTYEQIKRTVNVDHKMRDFNRNTKMVHYEFIAL